MSLRNGKHSTNSFCYVCGDFINLKARKITLATNIKICETYQVCFKIPMQNQDKKWAPNFSCYQCKTSLLTLNMEFLMQTGIVENQKNMRFTVPRIWREPTNHINDCYFCIVEPQKGRSAKKTLYPDLPSTSAPVLCSEDFCIPSPPKKFKKFTRVPSPVKSVSSYENECSGHKIFTEVDFNDLVKDLKLPKTTAEVLGSRLQQRNLIEPYVKITKQRKRHEVFSSFFTKEDGLCYCNDVKGLFHEIGIPCDSSDWRLFIDSSSISLKAVLLHNGNKFPSIPVAHSVMLKECYDSVKMLLEKLNYNNYSWQVIGDFKMVGFLMGMQGGYTKYSCFLCLWDSRADSVHYKQHSWPERAEFKPGEHNVKWQLLMKPENILMPPLHIKLGLMKQFVKALSQDSEAFKFLRNIFPKLSEAKVKAGIFVGPQIKKVMASEKFSMLLSTIEKETWDSVKDVFHKFLGNNRDENYEEIISNMLRNFKRMGCRMSLKIHMLHAHLNKFKNNMGQYSEEQGERFHQDISDFENRYQGRYDENMMGDYIWTLTRESPIQNKRNASRIHF